VRNIDSKEHYVMGSFTVCTKLPNIVSDQIKKAVMGETWRKQEIRAKF
jgi:hypothetical protein